MQIAKEIQTLTNGDLVKIEHVEAYPDNYHDTVNNAENEVKTNTQPAMKDINVNDYETIYMDIQSGGMMHQCLFIHLWRTII